MPGKGSAHSVASDIQNIRKILDDYEFGFPIIKELIQNADDAGASNLDIGWFHGFPDSKHPLMRGPLLFAGNDGTFTPSNANALKNLGLSDKPGNDAAVGKFGVGLKSLFHLCEAFFYLGAEHNGAQSFGDIYNPWSPQPGSDEPERHKDWDEAVIDGMELVSFLRMLRPDGPWATPGKGWFCLWAPLRQQEHCRDVRPIKERYLGDDLALLKGFLHPLPWKEICTILPVLTKLRSVALWTPSEGRLSLEATVRLPAQSTRSLWSRREEEFLAKPNEIMGCIEAPAEGVTETVYAGVEVCPEHEGLSRRKEDKEWPQRIGLKPDGSDEQVPEKAAPHSMVCFIRFPDQDSRGTLTTRWSVFLPVGTPEVKECDTPLEVSLVLHGYFFVDAGRSRIDFPEGFQGKSTEMPLARKWNGTLLRDVLLPQVLPALAGFVEYANLNEGQITALTGLLRRSLVWQVTNRPHVCKTHQWVYRILPSGGKWSLVDASQDVLEVPEGPADVYRAVFPHLEALSDEHCLTLDGKPPISNKSAAQWPEAAMERMLDVPIDVFDDEEQLTYLIRFLEARKTDLMRFKSSQGALLRSVRRAFHKLGPTVLRHHKEAVSKVLENVEDNLFFLRCETSALTGLVFQGLAELDLDAMLVPQDFVSTSSKGPGQQGKLSICDAEKILRLLASPPKEWPNEGYDQLRSILATTVIRGVGDDRGDLLQKCAELLLFRGFDCAVRPKGAFSVFSHRALADIHGTGLLFTDARDGRELALKLQMALATAHVLMVAPEICSSLFVTDPKPGRCTNEACVEIVVGWEHLNEAEARAPLFKELLHAQVR
jgi:hypothetical protein